MMKLTTALLAGTAAATLVAATAMAQQKAPLSILRVIDADNYDPIRSTATSAAEVLYMLADTLVTVDFDMKTIKPGLAQSWSASPDGTSYTFNLRKDVKFCDGRPMTAADVVYSLKRWTDPNNKSPVAFRAGSVKDIRADGDWTLIYELKEPHADLLFQLALSFASVIDKDSVERLGQNFGVQGFNGTGPYCWSKWIPRQELVLRKNPHYSWGPPIYKDPKPQIDEIVWKIIPESNTLMAAIQARQADITYYMPYIALESMQRISGMQVQRQQNYIYDTFMGFKIDKPISGEKAIRQAVNMAVDKEAIAKAVFFGKGQTLPALLNASALDYDRDSAAKMPKYNPPAAVRLLDEAGWKPGADGVREKDGRRAAFTVYGIRNDVNPRISEAMQADLRKIGIEMKIQLWDATVAWGKLATQEFDAFYMSYPYATATEALNLYFASRQVPTPNRMNWKDPKTDELLKTAATAVDPDKRRQAIAAVQTQLTEANVWVPLVSQPLWVVSGDRVEGVRAHGIYGAGLYKGLDIKLKR